MTRQHARPQSQRQLRVGEELRHALVRILERAPLRDPALQGVNVTVTGVRISADLRHALFLVLPFGGGDSGKLVKALGRAAPFLRGRLAQEVRLRYMPELAFAADASFERAAAIDRLLHRPDVARDLAAPPARQETEPGAEPEAKQETDGDGGGT